MKRYEVILREIDSLHRSIRPEEFVSGEVEFTENVDVKPGQYFQVWRDSDQSLIPYTSFAASLVNARRLLLDQILGNWNPGDKLNLWGPLGKGFELSDDVHFICMAAMDGDPVRLMPLIFHALRQGASVSLFLDDPSDPLLISLPVEVEVQPFLSLPESLQWAEYLYFDIARGSLPQLRELLAGWKKICPGQVLVRTDMPCAGIADCQFCAVETRRGVKLACKDGPVFKLEELINVE